MNENKLIFGQIGQGMGCSSKRIIEAISCNFNILNSIETRNLYSNKEIAAWKFQA